MNSESDLILSRLARDLHVITDVEGTEQQQHDAGGQVGEGPLQREADRQRGRAQNRDEACRLDPEQLRHCDPDHDEDWVASKTGRNTVTSASIRCVTVNRRLTNLCARPDRYQPTISRTAA
jgi:hypothetical protein